MYFPWDLEEFLNSKRGPLKILIKKKNNKKTIQSKTFTIYYLPSTILILEL